LTGDSSSGAKKSAKINPTTRPAQSPHKVLKTINDRVSQNNPVNKVRTILDNKVRTILDNKVRTILDNTVRTILGNNVYTILNNKVCTIPRTKIN
jgi:hypothetical protein